MARYDFDEEFLEHGISSDNIPAAFLAVPTATPEVTFWDMIYDDVTHEEALENLVRSQNGYDDEIQFSEDIVDENPEAVEMAIYQNTIRDNRTDALVSQGLPPDVAFKQATDSVDSLLTPYGIGLSPDELDVINTDYPGAQQLSGVDPYDYSLYMDEAEYMYDTNYGELDSIINNVDDVATQYGLLENVGDMYAEAGNRIESNIGRDVENQVDYEELYGDFGGEEQETQDYRDVSAPRFLSYEELYSDEDISPISYDSVIRESDPSVTEAGIMPDKSDIEQGISWLGGKISDIASDVTGWIADKASDTYGSVGYPAMQVDAQSQDDETISIWKEKIRTHGVSEFLNDIPTYINVGSEYLLEQFIAEQRESGDMDWVTINQMENAIQESKNDLTGTGERAIVSSPAQPPEYYTYEGQVPSPTGEVNLDPEAAEFERLTDFTPRETTEETRIEQQLDTEEKAEDSPQLLDLISRGATREGAEYIIENGITAETIDGALMLNLLIDHGMSPDDAEKRRKELTLGLPVQPSSFATPEEFEKKVDEIERGKKDERKAAGIIDERSATDETDDAMLAKKQAEKETQKKIDRASQFSTEDDVFVPGGEITGDESYFGEKMSYSDRFANLFNRQKGSGAYEAQRVLGDIYFDVDALYHLQENLSARHDYNPFEVGVGATEEKSYTGDALFGADKSLDYEIGIEGEPGYQPSMDKRNQSQLDEIRGFSDYASRYIQDPSIRTANAFYGDFENLRDEMNLYNGLSREETFARLLDTAEEDSAMDTIWKRDNFFDPTNNKSVNRLGRLISLYHAPKGADRYTKNMLTNSITETLGSWIQSGRSMEDFMNVFGRKEQLNVSTGNGPRTIVDLEDAMMGF